MAVAVNIILRNLLEEMSAAEHLWANDSAPSNSSTDRYSINVLLFVI